jgi:hypothetical protein
MPRRQKCTTNQPVEPTPVPVSLVSVVSEKLLHLKNHTLHARTSYHREDSKRNGMFYGCNGKSLTSLTTLTRPAREKGLGSGLIKVTGLSEGEAIAFPCCHDL